MKLFLKILKGTLLIGALACAILTLIYFILGIRDSCFANDVITAQNRINGAYQFLRMIICAIVCAGALIGSHFIKENILPEGFITNVKNFFRFKKKEK